MHIIVWSIVLWLSFRIYREAKDGLRERKARRRNTALRPR
jgi:hypothetical protein